MVNKYSLDASSVTNWNLRLHLNTLNSRQEKQSSNLKQQALKFFNIFI